MLIRKQKRSRTCRNDFPMNCPIVMLVHRDVKRCTAPPQLQPHLFMLLHPTHTYNCKPEQHDPTHPLILQQKRTTQGNERILSQV